MVSITLQWIIDITLSELQQRFNFLSIYIYNGNILKDHLRAEKYKYDETL